MTKRDDGRDPATGRARPGAVLNPTGKGGPPPAAHRFQPGQSGNPGGKTSAQRKLEVQNAEKATRIRNRLLTALEHVVGKDDGQEMCPEDVAAALKGITPEVMRMLTDAENRGLGAPKQTVEVDDRRMTDEEILADLIAGGMTPEDLRAIGFDVPGEDDG
ncbi:MAG TPA: hypothetical protein VFJ18_07335 [Pararhizobium sp.]|nr:hypothetical protein [Pararhizobium sp.]